MGFYLMHRDQLSTLCALSFVQKAFSIKLRNFLEHFLYNYFENIDTSNDFRGDSYFPGGVTHINPGTPADVVVWIVVVVGVVVVWIVVVGVVVLMVVVVVVCGVTFDVVVVLIALVVECVCVMAGVVFEHLHFPETHLVFFKEHLMAYLYQHSLAVIHFPLCEWTGCAVGVACCNIIALIT